MLLSTRSQRREIILNQSKRFLKRKQVPLEVLDKAILGILIGVVLVFVLWPFLAVLRQGLVGQNAGVILSFVSKSKGLIKNSLKMAFLTSFFTSIWSLAIVISLFFAGPRVSKIIYALLILSMISPPFVSSLAFINLFGRNGLITYQLLGIDYNPYGLQGIVLMQSFSFISLASMILITRMKDIDQSLIDSAKSLGAKTSHIIRDIILPQLRPAILVAVMLTFIRSLADFSTPAIIGGKYNVLSTEAYLSFIAKGDLHRATSLNLLLLIPSLIAMIFYMRAYRQSTSASHGLGRKQVDNRGKGFLLNILRLMTLVFLIAMLMQYTSILMQAFGKYHKGVFYFTLDNFRTSRNYVGESLARSILYSFISAVLAAFMGFLMAYYVHIRKIKGMQAVEWIATLPYIVPGSFYGIAYILAFRSAPLKLTGTAAIVLINMIFKHLPLATKIASAGVAAIEPSLADSVRDLGGHPLYIFKDVLMPQAKRSFLLAFFRSFASGMTTIGSIIFLVYPSRKLATMVLFDVIQSGKYGVASVLAVLITCICLVVEILSRKITRVNAV